MNARECVMNAQGERITTDKLKADLRILASDMEQLLNATAGQAGEHVAQVRARAEESLQAARARVADLQGLAVERTRAAGRATDAYVHANPWQVMAIGAVTGLLVGFALALGGSSDS
jgi:ElaB/YqjD/DUF883 family membrane-anchored ribosome-binding protein